MRSFKFRFSYFFPTSKSPFLSFLFSRAYLLPIQIIKIYSSTRKLELCLIRLISLLIFNGRPCREYFLIYGVCVVYSRPLCLQMKRGFLGRRTQILPCDSIVYWNLRFFPLNSNIRRSCISSACLGLTIRSHGLLVLLLTFDSLWFDNLLSFNCLSFVNYSQNSDKMKKITCLIRF